MCKVKGNNPYNVFDQKNLLTKRDKQTLARVDIYNARSMDYPPIKII